MIFDDEGSQATCPCWHHLNLASFNQVTVDFVPKYCLNGCTACDINNNKKYGKHFCLAFKSNAFLFCMIKFASLALIFPDVCDCIRTDLQPYTREPLA